MHRPSQGVTLFAHTARNLHAPSAPLQTIKHWFACEMFGFPSGDVDR